MKHDPKCTGCPSCSETARAILANPTNPGLRDAMSRPAVHAVSEFHRLRANSVEPPPDLAAEIRALRSTDTAEILRTAASKALDTFLTVELPTAPAAEVIRTASAREEVPAPPDFNLAILAARGVGR
jgi:hypothetical protein